MSNSTDKPADTYMMSLFDTNCGYPNSPPDIFEKKPPENLQKSQKKSIFSSKHFSSLYFYIKNNSYEVNVMWCVIVFTILLLLSLVVREAKDEAETLRVL
jgi:hypothetical protein